MPRNTDITNLHLIPRELLKYGKQELEHSIDTEKDLIKDFATHPVLKDFLLKHSGFVSLHWVTISQSDKIQIHEHDVDTLMIACVGTCLLTGKVNKVFKEGEVALIPKHFKHGLSSYKDELFWGLSLRFCATTQLLEQT